MIIDFHTHIFPESISKRVLEKLGKAAGVLPATNGATSGLAASMKEAEVTNPSGQEQPNPALEE